jgi:hypothetical protein
MRNVINKLFIGTRFEYILTNPFTMKTVKDFFYCLFYFDNADRKQYLRWKNFLSK